MKRLKCAGTATARGTSLRRANPFGRRAPYAAAQASLKSTMRAPSQWSLMSGTNDRLKEKSPLPKKQKQAGSLGNCHKVNKFFRIWEQNIIKIHSCGLNTSARLPSSTMSSATRPSATRWYGSGMFTRSIRCATVHISPISEPLYPVPASHRQKIRPS